MSGRYFLLPLTHTLFGFVNNTNIKYSSIMIIIIIIIIIIIKTLFSVGNTISYELLVLEAHYKYFTNIHSGNA